MSYMDNLHTTYTIGRDPETKKLGMHIVHENDKGKMSFIEQHGKIFPIINAEMAWYLGLFVIGLE